MPTERNRKVRERAYGLWVAGGHQEGKSDEHWAQAEREIDAEETPVRTAAAGKTAGKAGPVTKTAATKSAARPEAARSTVSAKAPSAKKPQSAAIARRSNAKGSGAGAAKH